MANYQVQAPDGSMHIIAGPDDASPDQIMAQAQTLIPPQGAPQQDSTPGIISRLQTDYANRDKEIQNSADAYIAGKQGMASTVYQNAMSGLAKGSDTVGEILSPAPIPASVKAQYPILSTPIDPMSVAGDAIQGAGNLAGKIPLPASTGYDNIAGFLSSNTPASRNVKATGEMVNGALTALGARSFGNAAVDAAPSVAAAAKNGASNVADMLTSNPTMAARAAAGEVPTSAPAAPATAADVDQAVVQNYDLSRHMNESFPQDQVSDPFVQKIQQAMPKPATANGILSADQQSLANQLTETANMVKGQPIDLNGIDAVDKSLSAKIGGETDAQGNVSANGRILQQLKGALRQTVNDAPTDGSTALSNGRAAAFAKFALNDIDAEELKAKVKGGSSQNYQTGYRTLFNDKDGFMAGQPQNVQDAMETAATPTLAEKLTGSVPTHLSAAATFITGHWPAAIALEAGKVGADAMKMRAVLSRGAAVKQAIIDNAMSKLKPVNVSAPEYAPQALLPAPGKAVLSNDEIAALSSKLTRNPTGGVPVTDAQATSGPTVIRPPVSQLTQLQQTLPEGSIKAGQLSNLADQLRSGGVSQNKFVQKTTKAFGLTPTKAINLAREIKTYGGK